MQADYNWLRCGAIKIFIGCESNYWRLVCCLAIFVGIVTQTVRSNEMTMEAKRSLPPLMGTPVAAGFPSPAEQYIESPLDLNELLVRQPAATFFVRAAGDSMIGAGICPGDILVVDRSLVAMDGSIVIAAVDNEFTVKYLRHDASGVRLESANKKYKPITFDEGMELRLFGVVTAVIHQFLKNG